MTTIKLLGAEWEPDLPASFMTRYEVAASGQHSTRERASVAALGLTWAHPTKALRASYTASGPNPVMYAEEVMRELIGMGASALEIAGQAAKAYTVLVASIPTQEEVERQADFSEASSLPGNGGDEDAGEE